MTIARLLNTVAAVGSVNKHVSGGYVLEDALPVFRNQRQPSTLYVSS